MRMVVRYWGLAVGLMLVPHPIALGQGIDGPPLSRWVQELGSRDIGTRQTAAESLYQHSPQSVPLLVASLQDTAYSTWVPAYQLLKRIGYLAVPPAIRALQSDRPGNRIALEGTVRDICFENAQCDSILGAAVADPRASVREVGLEALRIFNDTTPDSVRVAVVVGALRDPDARVRAAAADRLREVPGSSIGVVHGLFAAAHDTDEQVRAAAVYGLDYKGDAPDILDTLGQLLTDDPSADVRGRAALVLSWAGTAARVTLPSLIKALGDSTAYVRSAAARAIGATGPADASPTTDQAVAALRGRLADDSAFVRFAATQALGLLGQPAVTGVEEAAMNQDTATRREAVYWLARRLPVPELIRLLRRALSDHDAMVRREAAYALGGTRAGVLSAKELERSGDEVARKGARLVASYAQYSHSRGVTDSCYYLTHGPWSAIPVAGDEDFIEFPRRVRFTSLFARLDFLGDSVKMDLLSLEPAQRGHGPGPGHWLPLRSRDSLEIVWTGGMSGVYAHLRLSGDSLSGFAESFWDYSAPTQRATVHGRRVECQGTTP